MMRAVIAITTALILLSFDPSLGQNSEESRATLAGIEGVSIFINPMSEELDEAGMHPNVLEVEIERVLKQAGIPIIDEFSDPVPGSPTLFVEVVAVMQKTPVMVNYFIRLELMQTVLLERMPDKESILRTTWSTGGMAMRGQKWRQAMIDDVVLYTQEFVDAYYAANPGLNN